MIEGSLAGKACDRDRRGTIEVLSVQLCGFLGSVLRGERCQ
ncbi:hypothetical protein MIDIC_230127 [Alphaproteobacteria bacterium]